MSFKDKSFVILAFFAAFVIGTKACNAAHVTTQQLSLTVTNSSALALAANINRKYLLIQNRGSTTVYIKAASVQSSTEGVLLISGGVYEPNDVPVDALYMVSASGSQNVVVIEGN